MIAIINYGLGNLQAFANIYNRLNIAVTIANTADELASADKIVFPGVGAFDWAMTCLNRSGMRECLDYLVLRKSRPVLGICVGLQIMARRSDEGELAGLGWIDAEVRKFDSVSSTRRIQLPHMGWNTIKPIDGNPLMANFNNDSLFYFLHSYFFQCNNPDDTIATTEYGIQYTSAVNHNNIYGVQFHPEKSHQWGIQLLKNFAEMGESGE